MLTIIALRLGHEDTATTHHYNEADLAMKTAALDAELRIAQGGSTLVPQSAFGVRSDLDADLLRSARTKCTGSSHSFPGLHAGRG